MNATGELMSELVDKLSFYSEKMTDSDLLLDGVDGLIIHRH